MPLYEEKLICPFAIRFSQERIRPTFQGGYPVERTLAEIQAVPWDACPILGGGSVSNYEVLLNVPFPPVEVIRWRPKIRRSDGKSVEDDEGCTKLGDECWFTFDNRRLYCLQAAAARVWPRRTGAVVRVMYDVPTQRSAARKFRTTNMGCSVKISRRHDPEPRGLWNWVEATRVIAKGTDAVRSAVERVVRDSASDDPAQLLDVPVDVVKVPFRTTPPTYDEQEDDAEFDYAGAAQPQLAVLSAKPISSPQLFHQEHGADVVTLPSNRPATIPVAASSQNSSWPVSAEDEFPSPVAKGTGASGDHAGKQLLAMIQGGDVTSCAFAPDSSQTRRPEELVTSCTRDSSVPLQAPCAQKEDHPQADQHGGVQLEHIQRVDLHALGAFSRLEADLSAGLEAVEHDCHEPGGSPGGRSAVIYAI